METPNSPLKILLAEVDACPPGDAPKNLGGWLKRLDDMWPPDSSDRKYSQLLLSLIPVPTDRPNEHFERHFLSLVVSAPPAYRSIDLLLCAGASSRLQAFWKDVEPSYPSYSSQSERWSRPSWDTFRIIAGLLNLVAIYNNFHAAFDCAIANGSNIHPISELLSNRFPHWWDSLVHIAIHSPGAIQLNKGTCQIAGVADIRRVHPYDVSYSRDWTHGFLSILRDNAASLNTRLLNVVSSLIYMDRREILLSLAADDRTRDKANNWLLEDPDPYFVREFEQKANWRSLIRLAIYSPRSFIRHGRKFRILDRIELGQDQCSDVNESELTEILKRDSSHLDDAAFDVIYYLTGMTKLKFMHNVIPNILERVRYCSSNNDAAEYLWTDDASISGYFARKTSDSSIEREYPVILKLWANHVASKHAFAFCWQILNPTFDSNECGKTYDERLARLRDLLLTKPQKVKFSPTGERQWKKSLQWRRWYAALFNAICGLIARDQWNHSYGEAWVRQTEAISLVAEEPSHLPDVVYGILDRGREHWNVLDPIILGMPRKPTIECLSEYIGSRGDSRDNYFHAKLLLGHLQGAVPVESAAAKPTGLLGAVETLIEASRTKLPDSRTRTWIGDPGVESLWHGAIQKSVNDFIEYYRGQFGQDEHEHVAVLADNLVKCLNATNSTIRQWFQHRQACPLFIKASVRRFPKRAPAGLPQEGGRNGIQADIAFIVDCNVPGLVRSKRITLIQAKDLELAKPPSGWAGEFPFHGEDRVQINNLLCHSKEAHYLFFTHPDIGCHPMIFPALSVLDSCKAGKLAVPLSVVRSGGMPIPDFMLHGVIGLWAGDESEELIAVCEQGHERGLGPRILIDIKIARGDNDSR